MDDSTEALRARLHILDGLLDALARWDEVGAVVRASADRRVARDALCAPPFSFSEVVATHVLDMTVGRQTAAGQEALRRERDDARELLVKMEAGGA